MPEKIEKHPEHHVNVPEAAGVFDTFHDLPAAIYDLRISGFSRRDLAVKILKCHSGKDVHIHEWSEA